MSFPLVKAIYDNLGFLEKNAYLTRFDSCAQSVREYLGYRIPGIQFNKFLHVTHTEKRELRAGNQMASLVQHIKNNKEDGLYCRKFVLLQHKLTGLYSTILTQTIMNGKFSVTPL